MQVTTRDVKQLKKDDRLVFTWTTKRDATGFFYTHVYKLIRTRTIKHWCLKAQYHRRQRQRAKALACKLYQNRLKVLVRRMHACTIDASAHTSIHTI
jgi:hypothetical protein